MTWIDNIADLQYYHQPPDAPCYCEFLAYPSDLMLQGAISQPYSAFYSVVIYVYSADGLTQLEDASSFFGLYWAQNPVTQQTVFNLRLNTFTPAMCANACWILRVVITNTANNLVLWDKYTERFCQTDCCDIPRGITIEVEQMRVSADLPVETPVAPSTFCGGPLLRIRTYFDCYDNFTGDLYGIPDVVYAGTPWTYEKISNISARLVPRPRDIKREISHNCRLQKSESFRPFLLESTNWDHGLFPPWKMNEVENQFKANHIFVSNFTTETEYQFQGGVIFQQIYKCWELFRISTTLQECTKRQTFGCGEICGEAQVALHFLIPDNLNGGFYNESKQFISEDYEALLDYYYAFPGVVSVTDTTGDYANTAHSFEVVSTGYIANSFYYNQPIARYRVFGVPVPVPIAVPCAAPVIGTLSLETAVCETPVIGTLDYESVTTLIVPIYGVGLWEALAGQSTISNNIGVIHLEVFNPTYPVGSPANPTTLAGEIIATIDPEGRPSVPVFITYEQNENLPVDTAVSIEPSGSIRWYGLPTAYDETGSFVTLINIIYTL